MYEDLRLKGNDLFVFGVIYGFSKQGQWLMGGLSYLAKVTNSTKQGVSKNLKNLLQKGLIEKKESKYKISDELSTKFNIPLNKVEWDVQQSCMPVKQSLSSINNSTNNKNNKEKDSRSSSEDVTLDDIIRS